MYRRIAAGKAESREAASRLVVIAESRLASHIREMPSRGTDLSAQS